MSVESLVSQTDNPLSEREREVAQVLATGATNAEIARQLHISPHTVKVHVRNIFEKLEVNSRTEASLVLMQHGWVAIPGMTVDTLAFAEQTPDPPPLADLNPEPAGWQLIFLATTVMVLVALIVLPQWLGRSPARDDLLSDMATTSLGQPSLTLEPRWQPRTPLSQARSRMAVVRAGDWIYTVGGEGEEGTVATVEAYNLEFNTWESLAALPESRANMAAAAAGGAIYAAGGSSFGAGEEIISNQLLRYDIEADRWAPAGWLPAPLAGSALVAIDDNLYLLGGWDGTDMRDEIWRRALNKDGKPTGNWEFVTSLESPRAFFGATTNGEELFVVGGYDGQQELSDATSYNLAEGTSRSLAPLTTPRGGLSLVHDDIALYAFGGGWTYPVTSHERYDATANTWSNFASPVQGEWRHLGAASKDGRLHLLGGWSGAYLDSHLQYQSSFRALLPVITK